MQMNDVGLLELRELCYIVASIGNIYLKEVLSMESVSHPDVETFPKEYPK